MENTEILSTLSNDKLLFDLSRLAHQLRVTESVVLAYLNEVEHRMLHAEMGFSSLFAFCTEALKFSESAACRRIAAARVAKRYPLVYTMLASGKLNVTSVAMLSKYLTEENHVSVLTRAEGMKQRYLEQLIAELAPKPDVEDRVRKVPEAKPVQAAATNFTTVSGGNSTSKPLSPNRFMFKFTGSDTFVNKFDRAKEVLANKHPTGKFEDIFGEALDCLLAAWDPDLDKTKERQSRSIEGNPRRPPKRIKRFVWNRDEGRCTYTSPDGKRCDCRFGLEYDHVMPWAIGGSSLDPENIRLLCRLHNRLQAEKTFGRFTRTA